MDHLPPLIERAFSRQALHIGDLPRLDLYMDQVITLIENGYAANKRVPEEKLLTKTMVQNYCKAGLVTPIKGKKYTPEHIAQLLVIYALKRTLTIGEIKRLLDGFYEQEPNANEHLGDCYERSLQNRETLSQPILALLSQSGAAHCETPAERLTAILTASALSEAFACLAEELLDESPAPPRR